MNKLKLMRMENAIRAYEEDGYGAAKMEPWPPDRQLTLPTNSTPDVTRCPQTPQSSPSATAPEYCSLEVSTLMPPNSPPSETVSGFRPPPMPTLTPPGSIRCSMAYASLTGGSCSDRPLQPRTSVTDLSSMSQGHVRLGSI
ncbi:concanavalin A-like lectin protein kinase family protein [Striga asiatica]|uniref:Concanavalin A-like lectin protein kinase family protein n=1 Tax=Striga asiatica TaxID=4170 RepID=A0A5A7PED3_STRAF|nr:concanavalin A-like lectin protein kinase family protein [Striga asiatica]